jgi:DNA-binding NtrC family response regulator
MEPADALVRPADGGSAPPATETILLVEDDPQVRSLTRTMLARLGYRVLEAESADEALSITSKYEGPLDLVLTDLVMPRMSGTDLVRQMQTARPAIRVLYMSGYTDYGVINQAILTADTPFIQKPFTSPRSAGKFAKYWADKALPHDHPKGHQA